MIQATLTTAQQVMSADLIAVDTPFSGVSLDTRELAQGQLFFAIQGPNFDGHNFVLKAQQKGASAVVVERHLEGLDVPQLIVNDSTQALAQLATWWREQFTIPVVGITGSCGKTTTRQMLKSICQQEGKTLASAGNQNNQFGVPLTLLKLDASHQFALIEMGVDRPGEMPILCAMAKPQIGIITNIVSVHVDTDNAQRFNHIDAIFAEKSHLFDQLGERGCAIINADDAYYPAWQKRLNRPQQLSFGLSDSAKVYASDCKPNAQMQYQFQLHSPVGDVPIQLSSLGKHNIENALAAAAAAISLGIDLVHIQAGLADVEPVTKRLISYPAINGAQVIDDSYNANSKSMRAVIEMLAAYSGTRIMVLGDMCEAGDDSIRQHRDIGTLAKQRGIDYLFAYGDHSQYSVEAFADNGYYFTSHDALIHALTPKLNHQTTVLVKGSRGMAMETIVNAIKRNNTCYSG